MPATLFTHDNLNHHTLYWSKVKTGCCACRLQSFITIYTHCYHYLFDCYEFNGDDWLL